MNALLPFLILGITAGSVYGLTGTGLVLTYKTSGIFNFAQGAVATTGAYAFYILHDDVLHLPAVPTALICVLVVGPVLGLGLEAMARRLAHASATMQVVATIGLVLVVQGIFSATFGTLARTFPAWLPQHTVNIAGGFVGVDQMIITGIALAATVALFLFFRLTRLGLAMRGVVDNPELLDLGGTSPAAVRRWAWIIGSSLATLAGILLAPTLNLDAVVLTLLVVQAFGAAAIGRFSSLPLTYIGGLLIGIAAAALDRAVAAFPVLGQKLRQPAGQLSGGQQQMLSLVRAYLTSPKLVLVDEASMGLAPVIVDKIFEFLGEIAASGAALLLVEQDVSRALALASHVYLLNKGGVVLSGKPRDIADDLFVHYLGTAAGAL